LLSESQLTCNDLCKSVVTILPKVIWEKVASPPLPRTTQTAAPTVHTLSHSYTATPPSGYNRTPHIRPKNYALPWTDPKTQPPTSSLDPFDLPSQTTSISDQPFCHNAVDKHTLTHRPTDGWKECLMTYRPFLLDRECHGLIINGNSDVNCSSLPAYSHPKSVSFGLRVGNHSAVTQTRQ